MRNSQDVGNYLQEVGREYGTNTGRRRRCGWLDLVVMQYSSMINGYDVMNLTKLDILDELAEIKIGVKYLVDGKVIPGFPGSCLIYPSGSNSQKTDDAVLSSADLEVLGKVQVEYVTLPGWKTSIASITSYDALPENCKKYIDFIEKFLGIPIEWIGVGPGRESMLKKEIK